MTTQATDQLPATFAWQLGRPLASALADMSGIASRVEVGDEECTAPGRHGLTLSQI
jgi:hypothetical protein